MKSTYKLGIAALMASVLTYTGCVNNLTDDVDADASVSAAHVARGRALDVSSVSFDGSTTSFVKGSGRYVTVTFNAPVDKDSANSAIHFKKFTGTTKDPDDYTDTSYSDRLEKAVAASTYSDADIAKTVIYSDDANSVTYKLDLTSVDRLLVLIDANTVKSTAGAQLDKDNDKIFGEAEDDDYFEYFETSSTESSSFYSEVFDEIKQVELSGNQFGYFSLNLTDSRVVFTSSYEKSETGDLTSVLGNVKVQYFNTSSKKWTDLTTTWSFPAHTYSTLVDNTNTYYGSFTKVSSDYAVEYRVVTEDVQKLVTTNTVRGYKRRADLNGKKSFKEIASSTVSSANFKIADNLLTVSSGVVESIDYGKGYKINSLSIVHDSSYDEATYSTDSNYIEEHTDISDYATLVTGGKYYVYYGSRPETSSLYEFNSISGTAPDVAAKLHFYNVNGDEVKAKVTQSYYDNNNQLVVVFDEAITVPDSTLYVYAEADLAVTYTKTVYTRVNNSAYVESGYYLDTDGTTPIYYTEDDVEYYEYYYTKTVDNAVVTFKFGNDTTIEDNTTGTALRKLGTIDLSNL